MADASTYRQCVTAHAKRLDDKHCTQASGAVQLLEQAPTQLQAATQLPNGAQLEFP